MSTERKKYVIKGEAFWYTPDKTDQYAEDKYTVTLGNLTTESQKLLDELEIPMKDAKEEWPDNEKRHEQGIFVKMKSDYPIKTLDASKNPWDTEVAVGNGSKASLVFFPHNWKYKAKSGWKGIPTTIQITKHVAYEQNNDADLLEDGPPFDVDEEEAAKTTKATKKARVMDADDVKTYPDLEDGLTDILPD